MGRYELVSAGSRVGSFSRAETNACFCDVGKPPALNVALHIVASIGANCMAARLMSHVGIGSSRQCFVGAFASSLTTSSAVTGCSVDSVSDGRSWMTGGAAAAVDWRTLLTFVVKWVARSLAVWSCWALVLGSNRRLSFDQSSRTSSRQSAIVVFQYSAALQRNSRRWRWNCVFQSSRTAGSWRRRRRRRYRRSRRRVFRFAARHSLSNHGSAISTAVELPPVCNQWIRKHVSKKVSKLVSKSIKGAIIKSWCVHTDKTYITLRNICANGLFGRPWLNEINDAFPRN